MLRLLRSHWLPVIIVIGVLITVWHEINTTPAALSSENDSTAVVVNTVAWRAPDINRLGSDSGSVLIRYGKELIANTAKYLGPKGSIASITNGMNCQNCHIDAGARPFGNCFAATAANFPLYRPRSGHIESITFRVNDCLQRSLNGQAIDSLSKAMRAMVAYITWLGGATPKGTRPPGAGMRDLPLLQRAANPQQGKLVFDQQCSRCHGPNGEGQPQFDNSAYAYPPLWGNHSYNTGAGMYRLSKLAAYVKDNMPFDKASHSSPVLTDEQAWDVAAFINSQPRPKKSLAGDWPHTSEKAFDYPFGPYTDGFSEKQHKYGPFAPIKAIKKAAVK